MNNNTTEGNVQENSTTLEKKILSCFLRWSFPFSTNGTVPLYLSYARRHLSQLKSLLAQSNLIR